MKHSVKLVLLLLFVFCLAITRSQAQTPTSNNKEFRSIIGQFGINLPASYSDYKADIPLELSGKKLSFAIYRWNTSEGLFAVGYAVQYKNLEAKGEANSFLTSFRTQTLGHSIGRLASDRQLSLESHPGFELVVDSGEIQTITRAFLFRNRFYFLNMSLNAAQQRNSEPATAILNSFRFLSAEILSEELARLVDTLAPDPLPQEPFVSRPTNDVQDEGLKGSVRKVVTESENYDGDNLSGIRDSDSELEFDQHGSLIRSVRYLGLPDVIVVYGYLNGERAARVSVKPLTIIFNDKKAFGDYDSERAKRSIELLKFKYKYTKTGQLEERRKLRSDGTDFERRTYDLKAKKVEAVEGSFFFPWFRAARVTYSLDESGNPLESESDHSSKEPVTYEAGGNFYHTEKVIDYVVRDHYSYKFDAQGNWTTRVTMRTEKKDGKSVSFPYEVKYRTITYF